jgi:hypothetical protein
MITIVLKCNAIKLGFCALGMAKDTQLSELMTILCPITGPVADNDPVIFDVIDCGHNGRYFSRTTTQVMLHNLTMGTWRRSR